MFSEDLTRILTLEGHQQQQNDLEIKAFFKREIIIYIEDSLKKQSKRLPRILCCFFNMAAETKDVLDQDPLSPAKANVANVQVASRPPQ